MNLIIKEFVEIIDNLEDKLESLSFRLSVSRNNSYTDSETISELQKKLKSESVNLLIEEIKELKLENNRLKSENNRLKEEKESIAIKNLTLTKWDYF